MITWIGLCAGEIWQYLDKNGGKTTLVKLFSDIDSSEEVILMALGWLAREGFIFVDGLSRDSKVILIESK